MASPSAPLSRLELLLDPGSLQAIQPERQGGSGKWDGDGVVTAYGTVEGRAVAAYAQDPAYQGGSIGQAGAAKIVRLLQLARGHALPVFSISDGAGARINEGLDALVGYTGIGYETQRSSGVVPQISLVAGPCAGGPAYAALTTDFVLMTQSSSMFVTGPEVIRRMTGETITKEELGGPQLHAEVSGSCHLVVDEIPDLMKAARQLLSYLPDAFDRPCPTRPGDDPERDSLLAPLIPTDPRKTFDVRRVIGELADRDSFFEIHGRFARNIVVGFARLDGQPVGFVANQSMVAAGTIDSPAARKAARFINTCSSYNIPVIYLTDTPGFVSGSAHERNGILIAGAMLGHATCGCRSPRLSVCLRKAYGGAFAVMGPLAAGSQFHFALPDAELAVMGPHAAYLILSKKNNDEDEATFVSRYRRELSSAQHAAAKGHLDAVVAPHDLRRVLIRSLRLASRAQARPITHVGNPPL